MLAKAGIQKHLISWIPGLRLISRRLKRIASLPEMTTESCNELQRDGAMASKQTHYHESQNAKACASIRPRNPRLCAAS
jgi:hypothetical protein